MRLRDTILGVLVLGLVGAGVFWARGRSTSQPAPRAVIAVDEPSVPTRTRRVPDVAAEASMPDVSVAEGTVAVEGVRIVLSVSPNPPVAFEKNRFRVRVESASADAGLGGATGGTAPARRSSGSAPVLENGTITFEMIMPMGNHRYTLVPGEDGWQEADVVLPMCGSGNPRWYATVEGTVAGKSVLADFRFDQAKPGTTPK